MSGCTSRTSDTNNGDEPTNAGLPPDPGEEGKQTLDGVDSDSDGVRDDVQRYIALTYSDEPTQKALTQYAKAQQSKLLFANDKEATLDNASRIDKSIECAFSVRGGDAVEILNKISSEFLNTEERVKANIAADALLGGETFPASKIQDRANNCE